MKQVERNDVQTAIPVYSPVPDFDKVVRDEESTIVYEVSEPLIQKSSPVGTTETQYTLM